MNRQILSLFAIACLAVTSFAAQAEQGTTARAAPTKRTTDPAPGGGPDKVWANSGSKVYHCHGDRHYGMTKQGEYLTEADAKARGLHPSRNKPCTT